MAGASQHLAAALTHYSAGRVEEAGHICRQIVAVEPGCVDAWHILGVIAYGSGQFDVAIGDFQRALQLTPQNAEIQYNLGNAFKQTGRLDEAVNCYRQALHVQPDYAEAHNNLGIALREQGQLEEAVSCYQRAVAIKPEYGLALFNLATSLQELGVHRDATNHFLSYLQLHPGDAEAYFHLGQIENAEGRHDQAIRYFHRALELKPNHHECLYSLGLVLHRNGHDEQAIACYQKAIELVPDNADFHNDLGNAYKHLAQIDAAIANYQRAIQLRPNSSKAISNLGVAFREQGVFQEAVSCFRRAIKLDPGSAQIHNNLGLALQDQGKIEEAILSYGRALELDPLIPELHNNLGTALYEQSRLDEAAACYDRAVTLEPDYADAHVNRSMLRLLKGDFPNGWFEYEWRWKAAANAYGKFCQPTWNGESIEGKTILLYGEQGLGDTLQFIRYAPLIKALGATVILECQRPLLQIAKTCPGIDGIFAYGDPFPRFDFDAALFSLPRIFNTSLTTIPSTIPYLFADSALVKEWREKLMSIQGFKIGINWRGRVGRRESLQRDIPLSCFASLAQVPGLSLISLQQAPGREELKQVGGELPIVDLGDDVDTAHGAFMDTAAIMINLDLVITSDTSVAHLAGALGVPVWVALPFVPNWRWLLDRGDSPWYPTMRLFRQKRLGDWGGVFREVQNALRSILAARG